METTNQYLHEVAITAIIVKDGKYLITRRSPDKRRFPGMWTVPGGKMETDDYLKLPKDTEFYWYNVLERTLRSDGSPSLVISCAADYVSGEVKLQVEENDKFAWVSLEEAKEYKLLDGIYDELVMVGNKRHGKKTEWKRFD
jgi:NUDIX domain